MLSKGTVERMEFPWRFSSATGCAEKATWLWTDSRQSGAMLAPDADIDRSKRVENVLARPQWEVMVVRRGSR